ncbi:NADP-dependent 3-hydroxy acid dehydrogenase YdfG [Halpernia humi]|uniref:NADP-dependent 3-hydroxy acid dehydrogenase YdfG n=1 Tax=Halpernia humi TaxID=493375 RepID=A0A1H5TNB5_9FLAO|nr:SDR family oxidoreductase [Halpernia humi]SEF64260.1 NADP-dependent 3-hydroxy acid dehydrogenase YdfG [Halpernia humi]
MSDKKTAYVTGGSKGIGFGVAKILLENGYNVAISGRKEKDLEEALLQLSDYKDSVAGIVSNVRDYENEEKTVSKIVKHFGKLDIVIANAGLGHFSAVDEMSLEHWNDMIETNLTGAFHTLKASVEELKKSEGYYITISSLAGTNFFANGAGYNASKFGVVGFTQAAMIDLRKYNIKVSTIMPGSVATNFNDHKVTEKDAWKIQPEDIGQLVLDLLNMNARTLPSKIEVRPSKPNS